MITPEDKTFLEMLDKEEPKAHCLRAKISALFARDGKVLIQHNNDWHTEYNCSKIGCIRNQMNIPSGHQREICYGVCAEQWCIALAAAEGISLKDSTIYVTKHPCRICASLISIVGVTRVVYQEGYPIVMENFDIFKSKGILVEQAEVTEFKDPETRKSHSI